MKISRLLTITFLCSTLWVPMGCLMPHGSNARPVKPVKDGGILLGGNATFPFALVGNLEVGDQAFSSNNSGIIDSFSYSPGLSFDYSLSDEGMLLGAELSYMHLASGTSGEKKADLGLFFVNPRMEIPLGEAPRTLALTIDIPVMFFLVTTNDGDAKTPPVAIPMPTLGIRYYHPIGEGGLVFSQALGSGFANVYFPGSISYDIAIDKLHIMPEIKWDPTYFFSLEERNSGPDLSLFTSWFSLGVAVMYEF